MFQHELREPRERPARVDRLRGRELGQRVCELLLCPRQLCLFARVGYRLIVKSLVVARVAPELLREGLHCKLEWKLKTRPNKITFY